MGLLALGGCGTVGPPIPPEDVGIAPIIRRQTAPAGAQADHRAPVLDSTQSDAPELSDPPGQDEALPPLRPIGAR